MVISKKIILCPILNILELELVEIDDLTLTNKEELVSPNNEK
jgi:hypothetical protein